jgi:hypothetical protein
MTEQFVNIAESTLDVSVDSDDTTLTVVDGSSFPATGDFRVTVGTEIMLCTARTGNDLTVTRGIEGTTAAAHSAGDDVVHTLTVESLGEFVALNPPIALIVALGG